MKRLTRLTPLVAVAALAIALLVPSSAFAKKSLGVSGGIQSFSLAGGGEASGTIDVSNEGNESLKVLVYAADQKMAPNGQVTYTVPNRDSKGFGTMPSAWVKLQMPAQSKSFGNTPYLELKPGQSVPVGFDFVVPANATPGDHLLLVFFEMFEPPTSNAGASAAVSGRIGGRINVRVAGQLVDRLEIAPFAVGNFVIGDKIPYSFRLTDSGNVQKNVTASLSLIDSNDAKSKATQVLPYTRMLPGDVRQVSGSYTPGGNRFGKFSVQLAVSNVDDQSKPVGDPITKERSVWLVPLWMLIVAVVLLLAIVVIPIWLLRRQRTASKAAGEPAAAGQVTPPAAEAPLDEPMSKEA